MANPPDALDTAVAAALADAVQRTGLAVSALWVEHTEAVTWRDGSLGCPQPGIAYSQALVPGYRVRVRAGDRVLNYHAGRNGQVRWCPIGRAQNPLPGNPRT